MEVDALDKWEKERGIKAIFDLWYQLSHITTVCLRHFLTSRLEMPIQLGFKSVSVAAHRDTVLQEKIPQASIRSNSFVFPKGEFERIRDQ